MPLYGQIKVKSEVLEQEDSINSKPSPLILDPQDFLTFRDKLGHVNSAMLLMKNKNMKSVYFKIKSNASRFYGVRPNVGIIHPHSQCKVIIQPTDDSLAKLDEIESEKHRFKIQSAYVEDQKVSADDFWKKADQDKGDKHNITTVKLDTKVVRVAKQQMPFIRDQQRQPLQQQSSAFANAISVENKSAYDEDQKVSADDFWKKADQDKGDKHNISTVKLDTKVVRAAEQQMPFIRDQQRQPLQQQSSAFADSISVENKVLGTNSQEAERTDDLGRVTGHHVVKIANAVQNFHPFFDRVLVERLLPDQQKAKEGIMRPEKAQGEVIEATVLAVGPGFRNDEGKTVPMQLKPGDRVLLPEYGGSKIVLEHKEYHIFRESDIIGKFE